MISLAGAVLALTALSSKQELILIFHQSFVVDHAKYAMQAVGYLNDGMLAVKKPQGLHRHVRIFRLVASCAFHGFDHEALPNETF